MATDNGATNHKATTAIASRLDAIVRFIFGARAKQKTRRIAERWTVNGVLVVEKFHEIDANIQISEAVDIISPIEIEGNFFINSPLSDTMLKVAKSDEIRHYYASI